MTPEQFTYWLQGFSELNKQPPTDLQWRIIRDHLALVFNKVTPTYHNSNIPVTNIRPMSVQPEWDNSPLNPYKNRIMCSMSPGSSGTGGGSDRIGTIHHTYDKPHYGAGGKSTGGGGC